MKHTIKIEQHYLIHIVEGRKTFEVRKNDRDYQVGDTIYFMPIESDSETTQAAAEIAELQEEIRDQTEELTRETTEEAIRTRNTLIRMDEERIAELRSRIAYLHAGDYSESEAEAEMEDEAADYEALVNNEMREEVAALVEQIRDYSERMGNESTPGGIMTLNMLKSQADERCRELRRQLAARRQS